MNLTAKEQRELDLLTRISVAIEEGSEVSASKGGIPLLLCSHKHVYGTCSNGERPPSLPPSLPSSLSLFPICWP